MRINDVHDRAVAFVAHNEEVRIQGLALPSLHVWHAERPGFAILIAKPGNEIIPGEFFGQPARGGDDPVSRKGLMVGAMALIERMPGCKPRLLDWRTDMQMIGKGRFLNVYDEIAAQSLSC